MQAILNLLRVGYVVLAAYITFFYHPQISYWGMINIFNLSERVAKVNAGTQFTGVITFFVVLIAGLLLFRIIQSALNTFVKPSSRPSFGFLLAVPPVVPSTGPIAISMMMIALLSLIYLIVT